MDQACLASVASQPLEAVASMHVGFIFNQRTYVRLGVAGRFDACFFCRIQKIIDRRIAIAFAH